MKPSTTVPERARANDDQLLDRLGLDGRASDDQVESAYDEIAAFLDRAPASLRIWAANRLAEADEAYVLLRGPRAGASAPAGGPADDLLAEGFVDDEAAPSDDLSMDEEVEPAAARRIERRGAPRREAQPREAQRRETQPAGNGNHTRAAMLGDALGGGEWYDDAVRDEPPPRSRPVTTGRQVVTKRRGRLKLEPAGRGLRLPPMRTLGIGAGIVVALGAVLVTGYQLGRPSVPGLTGTPVPQATGPVIDQARVTAYMTALASNDKDVEALQGLANLYFAAGDFETAGIWLDKLLAVDPDNIAGLLGAGAAAYNAGDLKEAEAAWKKVVELEPDNAEVHYDLGFLYLAQEPPNLDLVRQEWQTVIDIDPDSEIAKTVAAHLDSLAPAASGSPAPASAAPGSPAPAASPVPSPQPSAGS